jgi:hypothetical protein
MLISCQVKPCPFILKRVFGNDKGSPTISQCSRNKKYGISMKKLGHELDYLAFRGRHFMKIRKFSGRSDPSPPPVSLPLHDKQKQLSWLKAMAMAMQAARICAFLNVRKWLCIIISSWGFYATIQRASSIQCSSHSS